MTHSPSLAIRAAQLLLLVAAFLLFPLLIIVYLWRSDRRVEP